jgi:hypothetical protein
MFDASIGWIAEYSTYQANAMFKVENVITTIADAGRADLSEMLLFPNPASEGAVLVTVSISEQAKGQLFVSDGTGRMLRKMNVRGTVPKRSFVLDLNGLASGTYIVTFSSAGSRTSKRLVEQQRSTTCRIALWVAASQQTLVPSLLVRQMLTAVATTIATAARTLLAQ